MAPAPNIDLKLPGVSFYPRTGKWAARISESGVRRHLGYFDDQHDAHAAYLEAKDAKPPPGPTAPPLRAIPKPRPRPNEPIVASVLDALFCQDFVSVFIENGGQDEDFVAAALTIIEVSRRERIDVRTVSETFMFAPYDPMDLSMITPDVLQARLQFLRDRGLIDRTAEIADRLAYGRPRPTFESVVAELSAEGML